MADKASFEHLSEYYRFQSKIYDLTRWSFLYGRESILRKIPIDRRNTFSVLEVGCGTGKNIIPFAKHYPKAQITGIDLSEDMLDIAARKTAQFGSRIKVKKAAYGEDQMGEKYDLVLCAYMLTMTGDLYPKMIAQAYQDLKIGGFMAVVDFHNANFNFYRKFMYKNHVMLEGQLKPILDQTFEPYLSKVYPSYTLGVWQWLQFIGKKG